MKEADALRGLEAASRLAALSPQTQARLEVWDRAGLPVGLWVPSAFIQIGRAIASKRQPVSDRDLARLFTEIERLMHSTDGVIANAVATDLLEAVSTGALESGFDFSRVDPHLGRESRRYLLAWDDFLGQKTPGLTRR